MFLIPTEYNFKQLIGSSINEVSFVFTTIHLSFFSEHKIKFQIFGPFNVINGDKVIECETTCEMKDDYGLVKLIDKTVIDVNINKDRDKLSIIFEDNSILNLISSSHFESFIIYLDNEEIIV